MRRALALLAIFGLLGCQPEMSDMMQDGPMDGGRPDERVGMPDGMPPDGMPPDADPSALRINHLQMRATVNSYHDVNHGSLPELMGYVHLPLDEQAAEQGIRVFDIDIDWDQFSGIGLHPQFTDHPLDDLSHCGSWLSCMYQLDDWMDAHPDHPLVVVLVGETVYLFGEYGLHHQLDDVEHDAAFALQRERILTPDDVRRGHPTLRDAITARGWPTVDETRGKVMLVLNDRALVRATYIDEGGLDPDDRLFFVIGDPATVDAPDTGDEVVFTFEPRDLEDPWQFETDPMHLPRITALARRGYLVHAISDAPDMIRELRDAGAHFIGTRYPERFGPIGADGPTVCNPITRPAACDIAEIEP